MAHELFGFKKYILTKKKIVAQLQIFDPFTSLMTSQ